MIGTTLAHYRITASLGKGGMGEVWRAEDTKLGREVALKILPEEHLEHPDRIERFEREARAVAALNHPSIVTIFSVEDAEGVRFLTMELIDGKTLDSFISVRGMDLNRFLDLASPIAEALASAHERGVIHRDLKPSNVMVTEEMRVKVLDFGLAKLMDVQDDADPDELATEALTGFGVVMGTMPYMSPEQVEGQPVDQRTDIFSMGILMYEMATGERPFSGQSSPGLMSAILKDDPAPVVDKRRDLPNHLGRIIGRCLEKDPRDRYQTARDVFNELRIVRRESGSLPSTPEPRATATTETPRSSSSSAEAMRHDAPWIAVLPFSCRGGEREIEAFADGLGEEITIGLSRFPHLFVISRNSAMQFAGRSLDVRAVGRELGARYVLEGAVRKAGSVVRVAIQVLDGETGTHLWADTYDHDLADAGIFNVQDEITDRVVATIADPYGILVRSMAAAVRDRSPEELSAKELVLRFCAYWHHIRPDEHARLRTALERMLEREANNAEAWACLARLYSNEHSFRLNPLPDSVERALTAARSAIEIDPTCQASWEALAEASYFARDLGTFRNAADRAMALNPRNTSTNALMGVLISHSGEWDRGIDIVRQSMELNPHHPGWYYFPQFFDHYIKREFDQALATAKQINMPEDFWMHAVTAAASGRLGLKEEARTALELLRSLMPGYRDELGPTLGLWILDAAVVEQVVEGVAEAEALVGGAQQTAVAIAVLPFTDMSPAKDQDYFCEGMAEEIMNALVRIEGIRVASRTSAFRARQEGHGLQEIARLLSVGHVLEGSVRTGGSRLRVTAQLTDVASGYQLWSERFDRELEDVFAVQDEIAAGVVEAVEARLAPGARTLPARPQAGNLEAYRSYLLGQHLRYAKEDHGGAVRAFQEAVRLDPTHAPSWTGLAESLALSAHMSLIPAHEACSGARKALSTALELQGESADGLHGEAFVAFIERRWKDLEAAVRRAIELQPSHVPSLGLLGMCLCLHQKPDEAEPFFERAQEADPLASFPYMLTALGLLASGRPQEAHGYAEQALTFERDDASALFCSSLTNIALGHFEDGIEAAEHGVAVSHRGDDFLGLLGWALASAGRPDEARALLEELRARPATAPPIVSEGWLLGALGEIDAAFEVFARAEDQHQLWLYYTGLPGFDSLRADPRFDQMLKRLGLPPSPVQPIRTDESENLQTTEKSIAVLPFTNMSPDRDNEYFSDGLSEEIINALTRLPGLRVIARTSAFRFRGNQDLRRVGEALGVRNVLEGSVRRAGERLRITAQLIDVADDSHIWSERFDREMTDVFEIQDEIAGAIVEKLHVSLGSTEPAERQTESVAAYEALLEARHNFNQFTPTAAERALDCLQRALSLEPDYPDALVMHAFYHLMMAYMFENPRKMLPSTRELGERALQVDPHHGEAQAAVAVVSVVMDHDWSAGELLFQQALEAAPASARVHELHGLCWLLGQGRFDQALAELDLAIKLDPLSALYAGNRGRVLTCSRMFAEAQESCRRGLTLDSRQLLVQVELTYALLFDGKFEEAIAVGERAIGTHGPVNAPCQALALSYALAGRRDEAFDLVKKTARPGAGYRSPLALGLVHAAFSEMDAAFACVEQSFEERDPLLMYLAVHPMFDVLRSDPRYPDLLQRMNLHEGNRP